MGVIELLHSRAARSGCWKRARALEAVPVESERGRREARGRRRRRGCLSSGFGLRRGRAAPAEGALSGARSAPSWRARGSGVGAAARSGAAAATGSRAAAAAGAADGGDAQEGARGRGRGAGGDAVRVSAARDAGCALARAGRLGQRPPSTAECGVARLRLRRWSGRALAAARTALLAAAWLAARSSRGTLQLRLRVVQRGLRRASRVRRTATGAALWRWPVAVLPSFVVELRRAQVVGELAALPPPLEACSVAGCSGGYGRVVRVTAARGAARWRAQALA